MLVLKPRQLTVLTTSKCTARCEHCSVRSGPERREQLSFNQIRQAIDGLHGVSSLRLVIFAGGEPTILGEDLLNAIAHADSMGLITRIVTNAYWAVTFEKARAKLIELREAGLGELNISADDYHLPYIPFERVENAWHASKGLGFLAVVIANCSGPRSVINPAFIKARLGDEMCETFDDSGHAQPLNQRAADGTVYALSNAYLQRLGRAHGVVDEGDLFYPEDEEALAGGCPWAVRSAALSPKNHLVACCGMEAEHNEVLDFGDAAVTPVNQLVEKADDSVIVNAIALKGPLFLKRFIQERAPDVRFRSRYATICEMCEHIVTTPEAVAVLRRHAAELALDVLAIRDGMGGGVDV
jgi:Radical SAM superfamily